MSIELKLHDTCSTRNVLLHTLRVAGIDIADYAFWMDYDTQLERHRAALGARLQAARQAAGLSQADVARLMGEATGEQVPPSRIGNYEQGKRSPNPFDLQVLAEICRVSVAELYGLPGVVLGEDEKTLLTKYRQTDERGRKAIHSVADAQPEPFLTPGKMDKVSGE